MPYVSKQTVNASNIALSTGNYLQRRTLLTTQPVCPPDGVVGGVTSDYSKLKIGNAEDCIKFVKFRPVEKNELGAMTFVMKDAADLKTVASRAGWTAIWWLPWVSKHLVKIKIRSLAAMAQLQIAADDPIANPDLFFTAAINGCSVFAVGSADGPSVYHAGVGGAMEQRLDHETTEAAWERLLNRPNAMGVGKTDYVSELRSPTSRDGDRITSGPLKIKTTRAAAALEKQLAKNKYLSNVSVSPFGMVFGMRDANGDWTMSLVRNATISCQRLVVVDTKKRFLLPDKKITAKSTETFRDRTYDADGNVTKAALATNHSQAVNTVVLGYQDFFPGRGVVAMRRPKQIQVF